MRKQGFTLAEVLITLGIIGVVAAMTIPTLISNTNGAQFKTAYKKSLSVLNQAVLLNVALEDTDFATLKEDAEDEPSSMQYILTHRTMGTYNDDLYNGATAFKLSADENSPLKDKTIDKSSFHSIEFPDGTAFSYEIVTDDTGKACTKEAPCVGFIDANGKKGPNKEIVCSGESTEEGTGDNACYVTNDDIQDIYPVYIYGQQIVPATEAARAVLFGNDKAPAKS